MSHDVHVICEVQVRCAAVSQLSSCQSCSRFELWADWTFTRRSTLYTTVSGFCAESRVCLLHSVSTQDASIQWHQPPGGWGGTGWVQQEATELPVLPAPVEELWSAQVSQTQRKVKVTDTRSDGKHGVCSNLQASRNNFTVRNSSDESFIHSFIHSFFHLYYSNFKQEVSLR